MIYTVYSYWNITELTGVFNAVASLMNSADYGGGIKFIALVAILSLAMTVLAGRGKMEEFWQWTIMVALLNGFLLVPKATVQIVDRTGTNPPAVIANVPLGMAALAGGVSTIGDWLTTSYEAVFSLPAGLNFENNGLVFGQKVQQEINNLTPATAAWSDDFNNFYRECLTPDIASGVLTKDQINTTNNIWPLFANTNPGIMVTLSTIGTKSCPEAYADLTTRLNSSEVPKVLQKFGLSMLPQASNAAVALNSISATVNDSQNYMLGIATGANAAVQQGIISNATIDAHCNMLAQTSNTALATECLTQSEGFRQTNSTYLSMANIAQSSMPKLRNAIELIQYAIFPIVLIFVIVAGHKGMGVLRQYVMSLVWIQLWPPLYAVANYMMNVHASYWANSTAGLGQALEYQQWVSSASVSDQAIAGMLTLSIPAIAAAIVKGGDVGMQAIGNMASPPHSVEKLATGMAEGNFQNGQVTDAPNVTMGAGMQHIQGADGSMTNVAANGNRTHDKGFTTDNMNWKAAGSQAYESKYSEASTISAGNSQKASQSATHSMGSAFSDLNAMAQTHGKGVSAGNSSNITNMGQVEDANQAVQTSISQLQHSTGISEAKAAEVMAAVTAGTPGAGLIGSSASISIAGKSKSELSHIAKKAEEFSTSNQLSQKISNAQKASRALTFDSHNSAAAEGARRLDSNLTDSQNFQQTATNEMHKSEEFAQKADAVHSSGVSLTNDLTTAVTSRIMDQSNTQEGITFGGHTYHNIQPGEIDALMRNGDPDMQNMVNSTTEKIMDERVGELVKGKMLTGDQVQADHAGADISKAGVAAVEGHHEKGNQVVTGAQKHAGVNSDSGVKDNVTGKANAVLTKASNQTNPDPEWGNKGAGWDDKSQYKDHYTPPVAPTKSAEEIKNSGMVLGGEVSDKIENTNLPAAATENAVSTILPSATNFLIDKAIPGQASGEFFNEDKDKFHGTTGQAVVETAIFAGGIALGATGVGALEEAAVVGTGELLQAGSTEAIKMVSEKEAAAQVAQWAVAKSAGGIAAGAAVETVEGHLDGSSKPPSAPVNLN